MMDKHLPQPQTQLSPFDSIRQIENGYEYWSARDLQLLMNYHNWREFENVIEKAMTACKNVGQDPADHFGQSPKMVILGSGSQRKVKDYHLTRYACYLVAMNADPHKQAVAAAQSYFAVKTREAELASTYQNPEPTLNSLWEKRLIEFNQYTRIPDGYWCIFGMVAGYCFNDSFRGVHLIEDALPDGSVGKRWCAHLRERGFDMSLIRKYPHRYPDKRGVQLANIYPNTWLGEFWTWFHGEYLKSHYPGYLKTHVRSLPSPTRRMK